MQIKQINDNYSIDEITGELYYQDDKIGLTTTLRGANVLELVLARDRGFIDGLKYGYMLMENFLIQERTKAETQG